MYISGVKILNTVTNFNILNNQYHLLSELCESPNCSKVVEILLNDLSSCNKYMTVNVFITLTLITLQVKLQSHQTR